MKNQHIKYKFLIGKSTDLAPDLKILKFCEYDKYGKLLVIVREKNTGIERKVKIHSLLNGNTTRLTKPKGKNNKNWKGFGEISGKKWAHIKWGAKARNIPFKLDIEFAWNLYLAQDKKCGLSDKPISFFGKTPTASLDRINSKKAYVKNNVKWVHKDVNFMKQDYTDKEYIDICKLVAKKFA